MEIVARGDDIPLHQFHVPTAALGGNQFPEHAWVAGGLFDQGFKIGDSDIYQTKGIVSRTETSSFIRQHYRSFSDSATHAWISRVCAQDLLSQVTSLAVRLDRLQTVSHGVLNIGQYHVLFA